jgi:hypothetical protein
MLPDIAAHDRSKFEIAAPLLATVFLTLASVSASPAAETYVQAVIDDAGQLRIVTKEGREIIPKKKKGQVGFDLAQISPEGRTVGWLELFPNCCTSYPIPLALVIYSSGRKRTFTGNGLPVWQWCFEAGGKRVAFEQETTHGSIGVHYELREVASGRLVASYDPPGGPDCESRDTATDVPKWVAELNSRK